MNSTFYLRSQWNHCQAQQKDISPIPLLLQHFVSMVSYSETELSICMFSHTSPVNFCGEKVSCGTEHAEYCCWPRFQVSVLDNPSYKEVGRLAEVCSPLSPHILQPPLPASCAWFDRVSAMWVCPSDNVSAGSWWCDITLHCLLNDIHLHSSL
jgi:hypothetical protein